MADKKKEEDKSLTNFSVVEDRIYRSGLPEEKSLSFLESLNLKSIVYLCTEPHPQKIKRFLDANNIQLYQFGINRKMFEETFTKPTPKDVYIEALKLLIDGKKQPILIHCNGGKHRTGVLVACLRKLQNWPLSDVIAEYKRLSPPTPRESHMSFIEKFEILACPGDEEHTEMLFVRTDCKGEQLLCLSTIEDEKGLRDHKGFTLEA